MKRFNWIFCLPLIFLFVAPLDAGAHHHPGVGGTNATLAAP
jgi:hypothetical protein